jgi:hypothetical protein
MGLYLAVFAGDDEDEELDGVEVGGYDDFHAFRSAVQAHLEPSGWGSRFPTLMNHPDAAGVWTPADAVRLERELVEIRDAFVGLPASSASDGWQQGVAASRGLRPASLHESFYDIDGEPLLDRLIGLARLSQDRSQPIWFQ